MNYIYIHIGKSIDHIKYTFESVKKHDPNSNIFFVGDQPLNEQGIEKYPLLDFEDFYTEEFKKMDYFKGEKNKLWEYSLLRIFYLNSFVKKMNLKNFIHTDNDILIFKPFDDLKIFMDEQKFNITPLNDQLLNFSYSYCPNIKLFGNIIEDIWTVLKNNEYYKKKYYDNKNLNEMTLLNIANLKNPNNFNLLKVFPNNFQNKILFDPGTYGQYLDGTHKKKFTKGYLYPDHYVTRYLFKNNFKIKFEDKMPIVKINDIEFELANLHVHSKNLKKYLK